MKTIFYSAILFSSVFNSYCEDLPSFLHVCHKSDIHVNICMIASVEDLRPYLAKGVPEYKIPSLEPLLLEDLITEDISGIQVKVSNVSTTGASDFVIKYLNIDWNNSSMEFQIDIPKLRIYASYEVDGKLFMMIVKTKGDLEANVTDCTSQTNLMMEEYWVNEDRHLKFSNVDLKIQVGGGRVLLANLFNGDKALLGMINDVANKNFHMFLKQLMPVLERTLSKKLLDIGNSVVEPFTYDQLFPNK